jgi:phosphatidylserine/phosphatidylglycerophosphate/cardiolipin synthase-like enzyme
MGLLVARRIGQARRRVRICSPVVTSTPVLGTLAELIDDDRCDVLITVDAPQMRQVLSQWTADGRAAWKAPLYQRIVASGKVAAKESRAFQDGPPHDYLHAKLVVADDDVLTGSYNLSHSGEFNAENLLELRGAALAEVFARYAEQVHARYASR